MTTESTQTEEARLIAGPWRTADGTIADAKPMTFAEYMRAVDRRIQSLAGIGADDIPDWDYLSAWEDGTAPRYAAEEALEEAGFDGFLETF